MNKVCMITGATSGIGLETARELAGQGFELFLVCRNREKAERTVSEIKRDTGNDRIHSLIGDFSSLDDVRRIAESFLKTEKTLHVLINNAGVLNTQRRLTVDGYEEMFAVNHLAHFLLTNLLLDRIKASSPSRIVNIASGAHILIKGLNFNDLHFKEGFKMFRVYGHSKLANMLFNYELAKRLEGSNVTANAVHPGNIATGLARQIENGWLGNLIASLMRPFLLSPQKGAQTSIYAATSADINGVSGEYFISCKKAQPKPWAMDANAAQKLWRISENLVFLK